MNESGHPGNGGNGSAQMPPDQDPRLFRFLRYSHVFSAAVREILETRYLSDVSALSLTLPQFHLLKLIALNGHHQVGEIAEFIGVSSPAATKNIDKLEGLGLVNRTKSKGDRRAILLSASAKGRRLVKKYESHKANRLAPVLTQFDPEEIDQLAHLMEKFAVHLYNQEKSESGFCLRCAAYCQTHCPVGHVMGNCPYERIRARNRPAPQAQKEKH